jgi:ABC-type branched-subunit amino acid transport system substrate-binding protein
MMTRNLTISSRRFAATALACVAAVALAACSSPGNSSGGSGGSYNIQAMMDLTGALAQPGIIVDAGAKAYVKVINSSGGVNGKQLSLTVTDTQSTDDGNIAAWRKAAGTNPMAIIDSGDSSFDAILPLIRQESSIPFLTVGADDTALYPTPVSNVFMAQASATQQATALVNEAKRQLGESLQGKTIGFVGLSASYIDQMLSAVTKELSAAGAKVVQQRYTLGATSISSQAAEIASAHPVAVFYVGTSADAVSGIKALIDAGLSSTPIISYSSSSTQQDFTSLGNPDYSALRTTVQPDSGTALLKAAKAEGYGSQATTTDFALGWIEMAVVTQGLKECGQNCGSSSQLLTAIDKIGSFTVQDDPAFGPVDISKTRHAILTQGQFFKLSGSEVVTDGSAVSLGN